MCASCGQMEDFDAAANLFHNTFFGSDVNEDWRRVLESCARVARAVPMHVVTMPSGLTALRAAAESLVAAGLRSK